MEAKDYKYIMGYLVLMIVGIFTFYYGTESNQIVSYIGFAGTLIGILLAIAALIYAFYQSTTSISQAQKLSETSDKFTNALIEFKDTQSQLVTTVDSMNYLSQQVATVDYKLDHISDRLERPVTNGDHLPTTTIGIVEIENLLKISSVTGLLAMIICVYQFEKHIYMNLNDMFAKLNIERISAEYCYGFLIGFSCTRIISIDSKDEDFLVEISDSESLKSALKKVLALRCESEHYEQHIRKSHIAISRFFGIDLELIQA